MRRLRTWWRRRSLRARLTILSTCALAVGLAVAATLLALGYAHARFADLDRAANARADAIAALAEDDRLPDPLPVPEGTGEVAQVLDAHGGVLRTSPGTSRTLPLLPADEVQRLRGRGAATIPGAVVAASAPLRVVVVPATLAGQPVDVVAAVPLLGLHSTLTTLAVTLGVAVPLLLAAMAVTSWLLLGNALRAVDRLRRGAEAVRDPATAQRLPEPAGRDEIAALAGTLNAMLDRLAAASGRERSFTADAAHELRSPLATMRTSLEVSLAHPGSAPWPEVAEELVLQVRRLSRLVDDLLVLARLDARLQSGPGGGGTDTATSDRRRPVDLACLAGVEPADDGARPVVLASPEALARAVRNLVDNAHRHARSRVDVDVRVIRDDGDGTAELTVTDDGPGVPPADRERIFERFTRLDDARARDTGGSGLGLAIARETVRLHGGTLRVEDAPRGGARFVMTLPLAPRDGAGPAAEQPPRAQWPSGSSA